MTRVHLVLYVRDQAASTSFYRTVLEIEPTLDVPGMTEFTLAGETVLGLMPEAGIRRLLGDRIDVSGRSQRAELYLRVDAPERSHTRAIAAGAVELSALSARDWGDTVAYSLDLDGHVLAFAKRTDSSYTDPCAPPHV